MNRNNNLLDSDTGITQSVCRKEWSIYLNMSKIYNLVYNVMDKAIMIKTLYSPQWMNMDGNVVETKEEAFGERVTHIMKHPKYQIFVDKVGNNTNMKDDDNVGGKKLLKINIGRAKITAATNDSHFNVLGFT